MNKLTKKITFKVTGYHDVKFSRETHGLKPICIPQLMHTPTVFAVDSKYQFGEALQSCYPLLELIFAYLDQKSLKAALQVNPIWQSSAKRELNKRSWPTWISYHNSFPKILCSNGFNYNNVALSLFVYNPVFLKLTDLVCEHSADDENECTIPQVNLKTVADYINKIGEPNYYVIACTDVSPIVTKYNSILQGIFIPHIPHVYIKQWEYNYKTDRVSKFVADDEQVKCCILFTHKNAEKKVNSFLSRIVDGNYKDVAMGGGIINSKQSFRMPGNTKLQNDPLLCITFSQKKDDLYRFRAYSVVIWSDLEEDFWEQITMFKKSTVSYKYGVIFRFCCSRKTWKEGETDVISQNFPDFVVFGMYVEGEIGWNTCNMPGDEVNSSTRKRKRTFPKTVNGWTSVLVLLTWD
ncbi:hypothetical protein FQA39_LY11067 [Lamprigera yunnana]|nr:hypothetical protein FQA39_LY11067 [Lamprigera yunnana]